MGPEEDAATNRWLGRPWLSRGIRFVVYAAPFLCSVLGALVLTRLIPPAHSWPVAVVRLIGIAAGSTIVLYFADRLTRRVLPLAALLNLTLVFPDEAPSRFKIAMRAGGTTELQRRLEEYRRVGADEPALAATRLLELVADLSRHDRLTRGHSERVRAYSQMIGAELGLSDTEIDKLRWAALLHDIGKLEIPFEILNKPEALTKDEYEIIKRHPAIGAQLAAPLAGWLGPSIRAVAEHHERWDGNGYPKGLRGTDISLAARIVAVADTFDVMTSARSYKKSGTAAEARAELARCAGTQFDITVVRAFLNISLGKLRLAMGPLSWLTQLAFFPTGLAGAAAAAPALMAVAGMSAAALGTAVGPTSESARPQQVAAVSVVDLSDRTDHSTVTVTIAKGGSDASATPRTTTARSDDTGTEPASSTTTTTADETTTATSSPATTTTVANGRVPDQTVPVVHTPSSSTTTAPPKVPSTTHPPTSPTNPPQATPTTAPPTTPPPTTPPPTTPPPTPPPTTVAPTTTPAPTTTVATTTTPPTTTPPAGATYLLASSAPGDVSSQAVLPLVVRAPLNSGALPNLDTDNDNSPGRIIKRSTGSFSTDKLQRFRLDPAGTVRLNGPVTLVLFAAAKDFRTDGVQVQAALFDCVDSTGYCTVFASATATFNGDDHYVAQTFNFGSQTRTLSASHNLELWIAVPNTSNRDMWMAYDTVGYASALTIT